MFSILDPVRTREALDPVEKLTDWELFQSLASELISPNIQIHSSDEADKAAHGFAVSIAAAYRLSTRKTTILGRKYEIPGLDRLLKHRRMLRKLRQETRDPACKTAVNCVSLNMWRMFRKRRLEICETKLANCEVAPQAIWTIAKFLSKRGGQKEPSAVHGPLGPIFDPIAKANIIADCLENKFRARDLCDCDCDHRRHVEAQVEALWVTVDEDIR
jgi:hypothetical protein